MILFVCKDSELIPFPAVVVVIATQKLNSYAAFVLEQAKRAKPHTGCGGGFFFSAAHLYAL